MLKKLVHKIAAHRHPWRNMKFDELAEIYTSMSLRSLGFGIIGIFLPIYLYNNGVDIQGIFWFLSWIFLVRIPVAFVAGYVVGRIGPKHSIAVSTILFTVFLAMLLTFSILGWSLILMAVSFTIANGLFFIAYDTDFSKIQHKKHGGKELGWLVIFEKGGSALGPFVGGLVASLIAPELTIVAAIIVLLGSLIPLFMTNEPVRVHQNISFREFPWRRHLRDFITMGALGADKVASYTIWPFFLALFIFTDGTYAKIGLLVATTTILSMYSAHMFGRFIDSKKGGYHLMQYSLLLNALLYTTRPFINTPVGAVTVASANEPIMLGYRMPIVKGLFDVADSHDSRRIVYLSLAEVAGAIGKLLLVFPAYILCFWIEPQDVLRWSFVAMTIVALVPFVQRFPALKKV